MNIGILSRSTQLYSTRSLYQAGRRRGHMMYVVDHTECSLLIEEERPNVFYRGKPLHFLDAIIPRIGASVTGIGAAVIKQFELLDIVTPVGSEALLQARDKMRCLQQLAKAGVRVPKTIMVGREQNLYQLAARIGGLPAVVKLLESTHGMGVELVENYFALSTCLDSFRQFNDRVLLQEYIREADGADTRVLVVDGKVVASMRRQAQDGEFRSNLHRGATAEKVELTEAEHELVRKVVQVMDIDIAGVDLIYGKDGPLVMEVNASPGLEGIENTTGVDVAGHIIRLVERQVKAKRQAQQKTVRNRQ